MIPITPGEVAITGPLLFDTTMSVYREGPTGKYDQLDQSAIPARFMLVSARGAQAARDRAELSASRRLRWASSYVLDEQDAVQIADAAGLRWQPISGSVGAGVLYRFADVVQVQHG